MVGGSCAVAGGRGAGAGAAGAGPQPATGNRVFGPGVIGADPTLGTDADAPPAPGGGAPGARADEGGRYGAQGVSQVDCPGARVRGPGRACRGGARGAEPAAPRACQRAERCAAAGSLWSLGCAARPYVGTLAGLWQPNPGSALLISPSCAPMLRERAGHVCSCAFMHLRPTHTVYRQGLQASSAAGDSEEARRSPQSRWA